MHVLVALVFLLESPLHVEVQLSFALYPLLFHVSHNAFVHCLRTESLEAVQFKRPDKPLLGGSGALTACSNFCWKWTNATVPMANRDVAPKVSLEARDISGNRIHQASCLAAVFEGRKGYAIAV